MHENTMSSELAYAVFETALGWMAILGSPQGVKRVTLPCHSEEEAVQQLGDAANRATRSDARFASLVERLKEYFRGGRPAFPDPLDLSGATPFQGAVWEATRQIPYGGNTSYGAIAEQVGRPGAARAVGQALGRNPVAIIIPCHRVLASGGKLGGFGGGEDMKQYLLDMEASGAA